MISINIYYRFILIFKMYKVVGIDEAGKGPVIGSMFIGCSIINLAGGLKDLNSFQDKLTSIGVTDSKKLSSKKRNIIYNELKTLIDIKYAQLTPALIDSNYVNGGKISELEIRSIVELLEREKPNLVIIDALTSRPDVFGENLLKRLSFDCKIISENKADLKYPIVGAASIIAKELREQELEQIKINIKLDCGSGYPSDSKTIDFIKKNYKNEEFSFIFRKSWATYENITGNKLQKKINFEKKEQVKEVKKSLKDFY